MDTQLIKGPLGLINPNWKHDSLWRDISLMMPMLEGKGNTKTVNLNPVFGRKNIVAGTWLYDEYGPVLDVSAGGSYVVTTRQSQDYDWTQLTFMFWATLPIGVGGDDEYFFDINVDSVNKCSFGHDSDLMTFQARLGGGGAITTYSAHDYDDGKVHCYIGTLDAVVGGVFYIDGEYVDNDTSVPLAATMDTDFLPIGFDGWLGTISSAVWWDRTLTAAEAYEVYKRGPSLGLNEDKFNPAFYTASQGAGSAFKAAFAMNSNIRLQ